MAEPGLTHDAFLGGKLRIWQPAQGFRASIDAVFLAAACPASPGQSVLELGTGVGTAALCLATRVPGLMLTGVELQADYAALARRNAAEAVQTLDVHVADLADLPAALHRNFDQVIANPPYEAPGTPARDMGRALALQGARPLADWIDAAARRLAHGGWLTLILATPQLGQALASLPPRLGAAMVLPLAPRPGTEANRVILWARKGGRTPLRLLPPFILHEGAGHDGDRDSFTPSARTILRDGGALPMPPARKSGHRQNATY